MYCFGEGGEKKGEGRKGEESEMERVGLKADVRAADVNAGPG